MKNSFVIITDTTCDIPKEFVDTGFYRIPMEYIIDNTIYTCGKEDSLPVEDFYTMLKNGKTAMTSQISPATAEEFIRPFLEEGLDVLNISFSSALSATSDNLDATCKKLQAEFPDRKVLSLDSKTTTNGLGMLCYEAIKLRKDGKTAEETHKILSKLIAKQNIYFTVDDLMHLYRGGRLPKASAIAGTIMRIKPLLYVTPTGKLRNIEKIMSKKLVYRKIADIVNFQKSNLTTYFTVGHCFNQAEAEILAQKVSELTGISEYYILPVSPIIGSHLGCGALTLGFFGKDNIDIKSAE